MSAQYKEGKEEVQEGEQEQNRTFVSKHLGSIPRIFKPFILKPYWQILENSSRKFSEISVFRGTS